MSWDAWKTQDPQPEGEVSWGDYGKVAAGTVADIGSGTAGLLRQYFDAGNSPNAANVFHEIQNLTRKVSGDISGSMTDEGRDRFQAGITSEKFWEHPFSSMALKATGMVPYVVASTVPALLVGRGAAALAASAAAGGTLGMGDVVEEIVSGTDKIKDEDLKKQSELYAGLRADMEERDARVLYNQQLLGAKPAIAFALGVGTGVFGAGGNIVRGVRGAAGARHGIGKAALEGGASELAEEGYGGYAAQKAQIEGGLRKDYDRGEIVDRALTGAALGGVLGGVTGIGGGKGKGGVEVVGTGMPDAAMQQALAAVSESAAVTAANASRISATNVADQVLAASAAPPSVADQQAQNQQRAIGAIGNVLGQSAAPPLTPLQRGAGAAADVLGQPSAPPGPPQTPLQQGTGAAANVLGQPSTPPTGLPQEGPPSPADMRVTPQVANAQAAMPPAIGQGATPPGQQARAPAPPPPLPPDSSQPPPLPPDSSQPPPLPPGAMTDGTTGEQVAATQTQTPTSPPPLPTDTSPRQRTPKGDVDGEVPSWLTANNAEAIAVAKKLGLTDTIGKLATEGKTAKEISAAIGGKLDDAGVRAVRDSLGIEPAGPSGGIGFGNMPTEKSAKPSAAAKTETAAEKPAPAGGKGKKILEDVSAKSRINKKAQDVDQEQKATAANVAEATQGKEKVKKPGHRVKTEKQGKEARATAAKPIVDEHFKTHDQLEIPKTKEERLALATKLQETLDKAAEQGHVLREDIPAHIRKAIKNPGKYPAVTKEERDAHRPAYDRSIPQKISSETDEVMYLREIAGIRDALVRGDNSERVEMFITEHNAKDLAAMRARRTQAGYDIQSFRGKSLDVEGGENTLAEQSKVITPDSVGKVVPGKTLTDAEKAVLAKEIEARVNASSAEVKIDTPATEVKTATSTPTSKPKPLSKGAQRLAEANAKKAERTAKKEAADKEKREKKEAADKAKLEKQAARKAELIGKGRKKKVAEPAGQVASEVTEENTMEAMANAERLKMPLEEYIARRDGTWDEKPVAPPSRPEVKKKDKPPQDKPPTEAELAAAEDIDEDAAADTGKVTDETEIDKPDTEGVLRPTPLQVVALRKAGLKKAQIDLLTRDQAADLVANAPDTTALEAAAAERRRIADLAKEGKLPSTSRVAVDSATVRAEAAEAALHEAELAARATRAATTPPPIPRQVMSAEEKRAALAAALKKPKPLNSMMQADDERVNLIRVDPFEEAAARGDPRPDDPTWLDDRDRYGSDLNYIVNELYEPDSIVYSDKTSEVLRQLKVDHLPKLPHYIQDFVRRRLTEILDHVPLHIIETHVNESMNIEEFTKTGRLPAGFYDPNQQRDGSFKPYIAIDIRMLDNPAKFSNVVIHEALHAALYHRLESSAYFQQRINTLMMNFDEMTKNHPKRQYLEYALTNVHEFVSEAMSNHTMQQVMAELSLDPKTAGRIGIKPNKSRTLWDAFVEKVREIIGFKQVPGMFNFLNETMKIVGSELEKQQAHAAARGTYTAYRPPPSAAAARPARMALYDTASAVAKAKETAVDSKINIGGRMRRWGDRLSSLWMLAQRANEIFGFSRPVNRLFDQRAKQEREKDHILEQYGGARVTSAIAKAERDYPAAMAKAKDVIFKASMHDVNVVGPNTHLGDDVLMNVQAKKLLPELQRAWADPAINPVRQTILDAMKFYKDIHNVTARETIKNILTEGNVYDPGLAERIFNDGITDEDRLTFKNNNIIESLEAVQALKQRKGWFVPFRRYGEFISAAEHKLSVPSNAIQINDNTLQFTGNVTGAMGRRAAGDGDAAARDMVKDYLEQESHTPQGDMLTPIVIRKVWVDKNDHTKILEREDVDARAAYRVSMQNRHVEFHDSESEALKNSDALKAAGLENARNHHRDQSYSNEREITGAMGTILRSLEKQQRYIDAAPEQRAAMREMFHDLSLGLSSNTSVKNAMKQRRDVAGMSEDLGRITADYARMTANHVAKLRHRPEIDKIFQEMRDLMENKSDKDNFRRGEIYQELINRIYGKDSKAVEEQRDGFVSRLLQVSRLSKLAGPSFHVINAHEPWTTSLPMIGARHGFVQTAKALKDTYSLIGARGNVLSGLKDVAKAYRDDTGFTDYVKTFKTEIANSRIAGPDKIRRMQEMIDYMDARNLYSNSAVFEIGKFANPNANIAGRAIDRADLMANQVGQAIESINRTVTGLTAYNLEYKKNGGNHEAAMHYAYQTAHETMGDYSHWNAAPVFNTQAGRLALQFKKFGHKTYYVLGRTMREAIKGDPQAMKQFAGLMVTHGLVAGVLGLPTEPFKVALMAANVFGATGFTPEDYDAAVRRLAYDLAGQKGGEIISKGLYRAVGVEVSGRLGLDSPLTQGTPRTSKPNDLKAWLMDTVAGAAPAYMLDQVAGVQALMKGDVATAITKMSPIRAVSDVTKAVVGVSGPKLSATGREQHEALSPAEAAVRLLGFTPSRVDESRAGRSMVAREGRELSEERTAKISAWVTAQGADKVRAQRAVQAWNAGKEPGAQITQKDLEKAASRRETEKETGTYWRGIKLDKRTKPLAERADRIYDQ